MYTVTFVWNKELLHQMFSWECKRVYLRTDFNLLTVLTKDNEYKTIDLKLVEKFWITYNDEQ